MPDRDDKGIGDYGIRTLVLAIRTNVATVGKIHDGVAVIVHSDKNARSLITGLYLILTLLLFLERYKKDSCGLLYIVARPRVDSN